MLFRSPRALSITQTTELGTLYSLDELRAVGETARRLSLKVHMDGSRFANAVAALTVSPAELTWKAGVDVLCMGGAKNGMALGEAVIFFNRDLAHEFDYRCKQAGQLASKMRFLAAPWVGLLESGAWLRNAVHANRCARLLAEQTVNLPGVRLLFPQQANAVFLEMTSRMIDGLRERGWRFYTFIGSGGARFLCSWETSEADVAALATGMITLAGQE